MRDETSERIEKVLKKWKTSRLKFYNDSSIKNESTAAIQRKQELDNIVKNELDRLGFDEDVDDYLLTIVNLIKNIDNRNRSVIQGGRRFQNIMSDPGHLTLILEGICEHLNIRLLETLDGSNNIVYQAIKKGEEFKFDLDESADREGNLILDEDE